MKLSSKYTKFVTRVSGVSLLVLTFQNCMQSPDEMATSPCATDGACLTTSASTTDKSTESVPDYAPTDSKQSLESMMGLLELKYSETAIATVNNEINLRRNLLPPKSELAMVSSFSLIATTSLAGVVCRQAVNKEKTSGRNVFQYLDFSKSPMVNGKTAATNTFLLMSRKFWGRNPTKEEMNNMLLAVDDYFSSLTAAELATAAESEKLAVFICSGMLAAPESYLL